MDLARQSRFQMDDDGDLHEQILHIEAHIEELTDIIEGCRKIILISKVAIAAGGILILATLIGAVGFDPTVLIGAIAAVIGGTVVFGSNTSTLKQTLTDMKAAEAHRTELISRMDLNVVGDGKVENGRDTRWQCRGLEAEPVHHWEVGISAPAPRDRHSLSPAAATPCIRCKPTHPSPSVR